MHQSIQDLKSLYNKNTRQFRNKNIKRVIIILYINGYIGSGKSSLTEILSDTLGTPAYYENVDDVPLLKSFYEDGGESRLDKSFKLQLDFLTYRYNQLRHAIIQRNSVLDSSLLSDGLMAGNLLKRGEFRQEDFNLYQRISVSMQKNIAGTPFNGAPDLIVFLDGSFDLMLEHIQMRGRDMEVLDKDKIEYFHSVWETYAHWGESYFESPVVKIDIDKYDYVNNMSDRKEVLTQILIRMVELGMLQEKEFEEIKVNKLDLLTDTNS